MWSIEDVNAGQHEAGSTENWIAMQAAVGDHVAVEDGTVLRVADLLPSSGYLSGYVLGDGSVILDVEISAGLVTMVRQAAELVD